MGYERDDADDKSALAEAPREDWLFEVPFSDRLDRDSILRVFGYMSFVEEEENPGYSGNDDGRKDDAGSPRGEVACFFETGDDEDDGG